MNTELERDTQLTRLQEKNRSLASAVEELDKKHQKHGQRPSV